MKGISAATIVLPIVVLVIVAIAAMYFATGGIGGTGGTTTTVGTTVAAQMAGVSEPANGVQIPRFDIEFDVEEGDAAAQDAVADIDIDVYKWDATKDAVAQSLHFVDCTGAIPAVFDGTKIETYVTQKNFCKLNTYKFWRDSSFTGGDAETQLNSAYGAAAAADLDDIGGSGTLEFTGNVENIYLVTMQEAATTDDEDIIPQAFLIGSVRTSTLDHSDWAAGTLNARYVVSHYSDARAESKTRTYGECVDDTSNRNVNSLDSSLNHAVHSSLTTADTIKLDCTVTVEITKDGYALALLNPLAASNAEKAYTILTPYGENGVVWIKFGEGNMTGDIPYSTSDIKTPQIIWQNSYGCGHQLTSDSTSDAVVDGGQNIYEDCYVSSSRTVNGITGIFDKGDSVSFTITISEVLVDYDDSATAEDEEVNAGSGSSGEHLFEIHANSLESGTGFISGNLTA